MTREELQRLLNDFRDSSRNEINQSISTFSKYTDAVYEKNKETYWKNLGVGLYGFLEGVEYGVIDSFGGLFAMAEKFANGVLHMLDSEDHQDQDLTKWENFQKDLMITIEGMGLELAEGLVNVSVSLAAGSQNLVAGIAGKETNTDWAYGEKGALIQIRDFFANTHASFITGEVREDRTYEENSKIINKYREGTNYENDNFQSFGNAPTLKNSYTLGVDFLKNTTNFLDDLKQKTLGDKGLAKELGVTEYSHNNQIANQFRQGGQSFGRMIPLVVASMAIGKFSPSNMAQNMTIGNSMSAIAVRSAFVESMVAGYFASSIYGASMSEALKNGTSLHNANIYAIGMTASEMLTERIGGIMPSGKVSPNLLKSMLSEGFEETLAELSQSGLELYSRGEKGLEEVNKETTKEFMGRVAFATIMGAAMGGAFSAPSFMMRQISGQGNIDNVNKYLNENIKEVGVEKTQTRLANGLPQVVKTLNKQSHVDALETVSQNNLKDYVVYNNKTSEWELSKDAILMTTNLNDFVAVKQGTNVITNKDYAISENMSINKLLNQDVDITTQEQLNAIQDEVKKKTLFKILKNKQNVVLMNGALKVVSKNGKVYESNAFIQSDVIYINSQLSNTSIIKSLALHETLHRAVSYAQKGMLKVEEVQDVYNFVNEIWNNRVLQLRLMKSGVFNVAQFIEGYQNIGASKDVIIEELAANIVEKVVNSDAIFEKILKDDISIAKRIAIGIKNLFSKKTIEAVGSNEFRKVSGYVGQNFYDVEMVKEVKKIESKFTKIVESIEKIETNNSLNNALGESKGRHYIRVGEKLFTFSKNVTPFINPNPSSIRSDLANKLIPKEKVGFVEFNASQEANFKAFLELFNGSKDNMHKIIENIINEKDTLLIGSKYVYMWNLMDNNVEFQNTLNTIVNEIIQKEMDSLNRSDYIKHRNGLLELKDVNFFRKILAYNYLMLKATSLSVYPSSTFMETLGKGYISEDGLSGFFISGEATNEFNEKEFSNLFSRGQKGFLPKHIDYIKTLKPKSIVVINDKLLDYYIKYFGINGENDWNYNAEITAGDWSASYNNYNIMKNSEQGLNPIYVVGDVKFSIIETNRTLMEMEKDFSIDEDGTIHPNPKDSTFKKFMDNLNKLSVDEFVASNMYRAMARRADEIHANHTPHSILNNEQAYQSKLKTLEKIFHENGSAIPEKNGDRVFWTYGKNKEINYDKKAYFVFGYPGSGKSTSIVDPLSYMEKAIVIDSDIIKENIEGFSNGLGAGAVHLESKIILEDIIDDILTQNQGENVIIPVIQNRSFIESFKEKGYDVTIILNTLEKEVAYKRVFGRMFISNRFLPVHDFNHNPKQSLQIALETGLVNKWMEVKNDTLITEKPTFLGASGNLKQSLYGMMMTAEQILDMDIKLNLNTSENVQGMIRSNLFEMNNIASILSTNDFNAFYNNPSITWDLIPNHIINQIFKTPRMIPFASVGNTRYYKSLSIEKRAIEDFRGLLDSRGKPLYRTEGKGSFYNYGTLNENALTRKSTHIKINKPNVISDTNDFYEMEDVQKLVNNGSIKKSGESRTQIFYTVTNPNTVISTVTPYQNIHFSQYGLNYLKHRVRLSYLIASDVLPKGMLRGIKGGASIDYIATAKNYEDFLGDDVQYTEDGQKRYSLEYDSELIPLSKMQKEYFNNSKITSYVKDSNSINTSNFVGLEMVYHGTNKEFNKFSREFISNWTAFGRGFYFSNKISTSEHYGGFILEGYLKMENPLFLISAVDTEYNDYYLIGDSNGNFNDNDFLDKLDGLLKEMMQEHGYLDSFLNPTEKGYSLPREIRGMLLDLKSYEKGRLKKANDVFFDLKFAMEDNADIFKTNFDDFTFVDVFERMGYDGFIVDIGNQENYYVAFKSNQFKLATNRTPTSDERIDYSLDYESIAKEGILYSVKPNNNTLHKSLTTNNTLEDYRKFERAYAQFEAQTHKRNKKVLKMQEAFEAYVRKKALYGELANHMGSSVSKSIIFDLNQALIVERSFDDDVKKDMIRNVNGIIGATLDYIDTKFDNVEVNLKDPSNPRGFQYTKAFYWALRELQTITDVKKANEFILKDTRLEPYRKLITAIKNFDVNDIKTWNILLKQVENFVGATNVNRVIDLSLGNKGKFAHTVYGVVNREWNNDIDNTLGLLGTNTRSKDGKVSKSGGFIDFTMDSFLANTFADPYALSHVVSMFREDGWSNVLMDKIDDAQRKKLKIQNMFFKYFEANGWLKNNYKNIDALEKEIITINNVLDENGNPLNIPMSEVVHLRGSLLREMARNLAIAKGHIMSKETHYFDNGKKIQIRFNAQNTEHAKLKSVEAIIVDQKKLLQELNDLMNTHTFARNYVDKLSRYFTELFPFVNERFKDINGLELNNDGEQISDALSKIGKQEKQDFLDELGIKDNETSNLYVPFRIDKSSLITAEQFSVSEVLDLGVFDGLTQAITGGEGMIVIDSINNVLASYTKEAGNYYGMYRVISDMQHLLDTANADGQVLRNRIDKISTRIIPYYEQLLKDMAGYGTNADFTSRNARKVMSSLRRNFFKYALALNVKVIATQLTSMFTLAENLGGTGGMFSSGEFLKKFMKNLFHSSTKGKASYLFENSEIYRDRTHSSTYEISEATTTGLKKTKFNDFTEFLMQGIVASDNMINRAFYVSLLDTINPKTKQNYTPDEAIAMVEYGITHYQSSGLAITKNGLLRTQNEVVRIFTKFLGEPMKALSNLYDSFKNLNLIKQLEKNIESIEKHFDDLVIEKEHDFDDAVKEHENMEVELDQEKKTLKAMSSGNYTQAQIEAQIQKVKDAKKREYEAQVAANKAKFEHKNQIEKTDKIKTQVSTIIAEKDDVRLRAQRRGTSLVIAIVYQAMLAIGFGLVRTGGSDKPNEEEVWKYLAKMVGYNLFNEGVGYIPFARDVFQILNGFDGDTIDTLVPFNNLVKSMGYMTEQIVNGDIQSVNWAKNIRNISFQLGQIFGLPVRGFERLFTTPMRYISPQTLYKYERMIGKRDTSNLQLEKAIAQGDEKMIEAIVTTKLGERNVFVNAAVESEIVRLTSKGYEVSISGINKSFTVNDVKYEMTDAQIKAFKEVYDKASIVVAKMIISSSYKQLNDDFKQNMIRAIYSYYYTKAKQVISGVNLLNTRNFTTEAEVLNYFIARASDMYREQNSLKYITEQKVKG